MRVRLEEAEKKLSVFTVEYRKTLQTNMELKNKIDYLESNFETLKKDKVDLEEVTKKAKTEFFEIKSTADILQMKNDVANRNLNEREMKHDSLQEHIDQLRSQNSHLEELYRSVKEASDSFENKA
jgi:chromosome segregation ATPase